MKGSFREEQKRVLLSRFGELQRMEGYEKLNICIYSTKTLKLKSA